MHAIDHLGTAALFRGRSFLQRGAGRAVRPGGWIRRLATPVFLVVWAAVLTLIGTVLMSGHWVVLPTPPADDPKLGGAVASSEEGAGCWRLTHVLYAECRCSQRIFEYLAERPTPPGVAERVLLVGERPDFVQRAEARGIEIVALTQQELKERFHVEAAPLLLIGDPEGVVRYVGGYTSRKQGLDYRDLELLETLRSGGRPKGLPAYGCGVSRELQDVLDPIGIKYRR